MALPDDEVRKSHAHRRRLMYIATGRCTLPLACTCRCGAIRVAIRIIVDLRPSNRPRCRQTHLAVVEPTSLVSNPSRQCRTRLAGVLRRCRTYLAVIESGSSLWNPLRRCGIQFVVVESALLSSNPLRVLEYAS